MVQLDKKFEEFFSKLKEVVNKDIDKGTESLLFLCYAKGWKDGSTIKNTS